jgi:hypothetical protein
MGWGTLALLRFMVIIMKYHLRNVVHMQTTRRYNLEVGNIRNYRCEDLKLNMCSDIYFTIIISQVNAFRKGGREKKKRNRRRRRRRKSSSL